MLLHDQMKFFKNLNLMMVTVKFSKKTKKQNPHLFPNELLYITLGVENATILKPNNNFI